MDELLLRIALPAVVCFAVLVVGGWVRGRRARRAALRFAAGDVARFTVVATGDQPYPRVPVGAVLDLGAGTGRLRLLGPAGDEVVLPAGRLSLQRVRAPRPGEHLPRRRDQADWVVLVLVDGAGRSLRLAVSEEESGALVEVLEATGPLAGPSLATATRRGRRWGRHLVPSWSVVLAAVAVVAALAVAALWSTSSPVVVTVTGAADEYAYCPVAWSDPWDGRPQDAQISCVREVPGDTIAGLALPFPFRGEVFDTESFPVLLGAALLLAAVAAAGPLWRRYQPAPHHRLWEVAPAWSVLLGLLGGAWTSAVAVSWVAAVPVTATVTEVADHYGYCPVRWQDPRDFVEREGEVSCGDEQVGDHVAALALDHPLRGLVFDTTSFPLLLGAGAGALAVAAVGPLSRRVGGGGRSGGVRGASAGSWTAPSEPGEVVLDDVTAPAVEQALVARSRDERWARTAPVIEALPPDRAGSRRWWAVPVLRSIAVAAVAGSASAWFVLPVALVGGWTSWGGLLGTQGTTERAPARLEVLDDGSFLFFPADAEATFRTAGGVETAAVVAWTGGQEVTTVTVEHSTEDPSRARVVGPGDGTGRGVLLSALAAAVPVSWTTVRLRRAAVRIRRLRAASRAGGPTTRYLLTRDDEDDFALLLLDGDRIAWALPLADPAAGRLPVSGEVELRGSVEDDGCVVPVVDGLVWWPGGPLVAADDDLVRFLVTAADDLEADADD